MIRRRYTIEASTITLSQFCMLAAMNNGKVSHSDNFVERVTANSTDEYYYVVLLATKAVHDRLRSRRFDNSHEVPDKKKDS